MDADQSKTGGVGLEQDQNLAYLFAAYSLIWIILFSYLVRLRRRQAELSEVVQRLASAAGISDGSSSS